MTSFSRRYAELYDVFYADKPYAREAGFIDSIFRAAGGVPGTLLDVACGTGSHAVAFAQLGYAVYGIDDSAPMVEVARKKSAEAGFATGFEIQDVLQLSVPAESFSYAVCLFDALGYLQSAETMAKALANVREALIPGGLFAFEFLHAPAMLEHFDPVRVRRFEAPARKVLRISETSMDAGNRLASVAYDIYELFPDGKFANLRETHVTRFLEVDEVKKVVQQAGLTSVRFFAGYDRDAQIDDRAFHVIALVRKPAGA